MNAGIILICTMGFLLFLVALLFYFLAYSISQEEFDVEEPTPKSTTYEEYESLN